MKEDVVGDVCVGQEQLLELIVRGHLTHVHTDITEDVRLQPTVEAHRAISPVDFSIDLSRRGKLGIGAHLVELLGHGLQADLHYVL